MSNRIRSGDDPEQPYVLVIGTMAVDSKGQPHKTPVPGTSTPGTVRLGVGGVGRNIAENLARLGLQAVLLSAVGDDPFGRMVLQATAESGVDVRHVIVSPECRTGAYIALLDQEGVPGLAVDDMSAMEALTPTFVYARRRLFRHASMIVMDANVPPETIRTVFKLSCQYGLPVCVDPTSAILAVRFCPYLADTMLITPNLQEAKSLAGVSLDQEVDVQQMAIQLVGKGVEIAIITLAEKGLYYATSDESGRMPALNRDIVDLTGAGDALTAAVVFGLLNHFPVGEAVRLGIAAAAVTIQCRETVCPHLSLDRLYDELVV